MEREEIARLGIWVRPADVGTPPPHPAPVKVAARADIVKDLRGWGTLAGQLAVGWSMVEWHAIGWSMTARGQRGKLVESLSLRLRHDPTYARAVALLVRPLDERDQVTPIGRWAFDSGWTWVECFQDPCPSGYAPGHPRAIPRPIGARALTLALRSLPLLDHDGQYWCAADAPTTPADGSDGAR